MVFVYGIVGSEERHSKEGGVLSRMQVQKKMPVGLQYKIKHFHRQSKVLLHFL